VRFPGKALADIHGKPMVWHVHRRALESNVLDHAYVATDDDLIANACRQNRIDVFMTRSSHPTGSDRVAECVSYVDADIYVNIQGDEPMIDPSAISAVVDALTHDLNATTMASNAFALIEAPSDVVDANNVKVILKQNGMALAYSRQPIPYPRSDVVSFRRQLGLYALTRSGLELFARLTPGPIERAESVEMLRFLENGYDVRMVEVVNCSISVDTPEDLERVRKVMVRSCNE
jgi:3-deoxy-manno-octulosonate cytidylyltransferase (CMP-KDO synthetase)